MVNDPFAKGYNIYWELGNLTALPNGTKISNVQPPYTHVGLTNNVEISYVITAINDAGESTRTGVFTATPESLFRAYPLILPR